MNKVYKTVLSASAAMIVAGASMVPANVFAWGDSANGRTTYTLEQINAGALGNTITFNSITNGKIGDERNFVGAKANSSNASVWSADSIAVKDGETYTIRLYTHNNNPNGAAAVAEGVWASFSLPTTVAKEHTVIGYLNSSNATPQRIWDEVKLTSDKDFFIEYVKGSAKYTNVKMGTVALPDAVITSGATIGYESLNGKIPGCYEYDGQVTIQVKVHTSVAHKLETTVRIKGTKDWSESVNAKVGEEVEYQIEYKNLSDTEVRDVMVRDILPDNMEYVAGSTKLYNTNYKDGAKVVEDTVVTSGINIGGYNPRGNAFVRFTAKVVNKDLACKSQLVTWASATVNGNVFKDDASVMVTLDGEKCTEKMPEKTPEKTPEKIVDTGAGEIAGAALGAGAMTTALGYFIASRKKLM